MEMREGVGSCIGCDWKELRDGSRPGSHVCPFRQVSGGHPISRLLMHCLGVLLARIVCLHRDCCKNFFNDPFFQIP